MLVTKSNFDEAHIQLCSEAILEKFIAFDTETTALFWWKSPHYAIEPRVFSMQFSTAKSDYYFDFGCRDSTDPLGAEHFEKFKGLFAMPNLTWFIHNAKFDMHHCYNHGLFIDGTVHCTQAIARVVNNMESEASLDGLSEKYLGAGKVDLSDYWKPELGRITKIKRPGENGKFYDFLHFDLLPLPILVDYGERDTRLCYRLGLWQLEQIEKKNAAYYGTNPSNFQGSLYKVLENERRLTKTLFWVERHGVQLDMPFVHQAHAHASEGIKTALAYLDEAAKPFIAQYNEGKPEKELIAMMDWNSGPMLKQLFNFLGLPYHFTEKGSASFDKTALEALDHELARKILEYRRHSKRAHTYLENYIWLADTDGVLHCNFAQGGPITGRMSCREPNLQNVPKRSDKKEVDFVLRKCFKPRPGKLMISKDYDQVEYRLMLDYAREMVLIKAILEQGLDVHDATEAELQLGDRDAAKTMNFQMVYGGGVPKLVMALWKITCSEKELKAIWFIYKWPNWRNRDGYAEDRATISSMTKESYDFHLGLLKQAEAKMELYFAKLPNVKDFIANVKKKAKERGAINTWLGRILEYGKDKEGRSTDYKAPNGLIQGGAGDLSKVAINECQDFLEKNSKFGSYLILHVHDELVSEIDERELHLVPELVKIMERCYPHRLIPLTAGAAWSKTSWGELTEGLPLGNA